MKRNCHAMLQYRQGTRQHPLTMQLTPSLVTVTMWQAVTVTMWQAVTVTVSWHKVSSVTNTQIYYLTCYRHLTSFKECQHCTIMPRETLQCLTSLINKFWWTGLFWITHIQDPKITTGYFTLQYINTQH